MRKKQLLKSLLVAAALCVGANAWAGDVTTLYERGNATAWDTSDLADWTLVTATSTTIDGGLKQVGTNAGYSATKALSTTANSIVTLKATLTAGTAPGRDSSYDYITIGGVELRLNGQNQAASIAIDGATTSLSGFQRGGTYNVTFTVNQASGEINYEVTGATSGSGTATSNTAVTEVKVGHNRGGRENYETTVLLSAIEVTEETQTVQTADYTINYLFNDDIVFSETGQTVVGNTVEAKASFTATVDGEETKFFVKDGETTSMTIAAGENVLNVAVRKAYIFNYILRACKEAGEGFTNGTIAEGSVAEGEASRDIFYSQLFLDGTSLYETSANNSGNWFNTIVTPTEDNQIFDIVYNKAIIENVMFFTEAENISGISTGDNGARASNGKMGHTGGAESYKDVTTLEAGKYQIFWRGLNGNSSARTFNFKVDDQVVYTGSIPNGTNNTGSSEEFAVTASTLALACEGSSASGLDWFYIVKTGGISADDFASYTINYVFEGETIKTVTGQGLIGKTIDAETQITVDDVKYYATDEATTSLVLVAGEENTLDVDVRQALTGFVNINAVDGEGNVLKTFSEERTEGEDAKTAFYTRAVEFGGQYYTMPAANANTVNYGRSMAYGDEDINITYTLDETISYYAEESELSKSRSFAAQGAAAERASGGNWQRMYANSQLWTAPLEAGTYSFEVSGRNQGSSEASLDIAVRLADGTIIVTDNQFVVGSSNNIVGSFTGIEVPTGASIAIVNATEYN